MTFLIDNKVQITGELWGGNYCFTGDFATVAGTGPIYDRDAYWVRLDTGCHVGKHILIDGGKLTKM